MPIEVEIFPRAFECPCCSKDLRVCGCDQRALDRHTDKCPVHCVRCRILKNKEQPWTPDDAA